MEVFLEVLRLYGLPTAMLVAVVVGAWRILATKDAIIAAQTKEIQRLNDARLEDSNKHGERMLEATKQSMTLVSETNTTLNFLSEQIKLWRRAE